MAHPNMGDALYTGATYNCNCSYINCTGNVSRATRYRHLLRDVLAGNQDSNAARPMAVEDSFDEVDIHISTHPYFVCKYT
jgi:hypothetical protein